MYYYQFITTQEQPNEGDIGQGMGTKAHRASMPLWVLLSPSTSMCSPAWKLSEIPSFCYLEYRCFMELSSRGHEQLLTQPPTPFPSPEIVGMGLNIPGFFSSLGLSGDQPSSWSYVAAHQESLRKQNALKHIPGNSKGFRSAVSGSEDKDQTLERKTLLLPLSPRKF